MSHFSSTVRIFTSWHEDPTTDAHADPAVGVSLWGSLSVGVAVPASPPHPLGGSLGRVGADSPGPWRGPTQSLRSGRSWARGPHPARARCTWTLTERVPPRPSFRSGEKRPRPASRPPAQWPPLPPRLSRAPGPLSCPAWCGNSDAGPSLPGVPRRGHLALSSPHAGVCRSPPRCGWGLAAHPWPPVPPGRAEGRRSPSFWCSWLASTLLATSLPQICQLMRTLYSQF